MVESPGKGFWLMNELMQNLLNLQTLEFSETKDKNSAGMIAALRAKIPPQIVVHYDRFQVRGKKGIAAVINQVCAGCHMRLPLGVIITLKRGLDIQLCDSCGRYLYLPEEAEGPLPTKPIGAKPDYIATRKPKNHPGRLRA